MDANCVAAIVVSTALSCAGSGGLPPSGSPPPRPPCLTTQTKAPSLTGGECPIITCGDNAPNAGDSLLFDELDLSGGPNYVGVHLDRSRINGCTGRPLSATLPG